MPSQEVEASARFARVVLFGKTGAGKSSLANALLGSDYQRVGVAPTTTQSSSFTWETERNTTVLVDTPGIMEAGVHEARLDALMENLADAHVVLWVVGYPDRAIEADLATLRRIKEVEPDMPLHIVGTAVDRVAPRQFLRTSFNPDVGSSDAEQKVRAWSEYLKGASSGVRPQSVVLCAAGESAGDTSRQYNLNGLHEAIEQSLPDVAKLDFIRRSRVAGLLDDKATAIIATAAVAAAAAAVVPIPIADAVVITGVQVGMVVSLAALHGQTLSWSTAAGMVAAAVAAVAGPMAFQQLVKLIPYAGSVIGPAVASAITYAIGRGIHELLKNGMDLSPDAIKRATKEAYKRAKSTGG